MNNRFRFVDAAEHPVVLLIDTDGGAELHGDDTMCRLQLAAILSVLAGRLVAEATAETCAPVEAPGWWERPDEPLMPQAGTLDRERQVWTDGTGHAWDLTVPWADVYGDTWRWHGHLDGESGMPVLRCDQWPGAHPLDVLRAGRGPIRPTVGGAA
ncbi:phiSA1p31-related protein [Streptomyces flaveolus]|uniref:phiSA1p31-related protein n=1 Tax=Streptomyces flaveolus TaxID=67297 RepID=UPI00166F7801|nr:phiSA1p31-related protein [Streptomyces flaveolus]GGQ81042.1 hypothetical protein GCM10010216_48600 [Streptomyces flaveolus]